jgi:hypothetical protein
VSNRNRTWTNGRAGKARRPVLLLIVACILGCAIAAAGIARYLDVSFGLAMLGTMIAAYGALSLVVILLRRRLVARLNRLPPETQDAWRSIDPVVRYEAMPVPADGRMSARTAVWAGVILINGPLIPLMVGPLFIGQWLLARTVPIASIALLVLGFALAWSWWSAGVTLWRGWAARRGVDPGELQYRGETASLLWPRGHFFEKTELGNIVKQWRECPRRGRTAAK